MLANIKQNFNQKYIFSEAINITIIIYALLLPFSNAFSTFTGPYILLFLWILEGDWQEKFNKIKSYKALIFLILFVLFNTISLFWSNNINEGIHNLRYYFAILLLFVIIFTSLQEKYFKLIIGAFLFSMFISEITLYGVYLNLWSIKRGTPSNPSSFMHHVLYSIFLTSTTIVLVWQIINDKSSTKVKIIEAIFLVSTLINLFINVGRTGQLSFIIVSLVFTLNYFGKRIKYIVYLFISLIIIFFTAYYLSKPFYIRVHQGLSNIESMREGNFNSSWGARILMKEKGIDMVKSAPFIGFGVGDDRDIIRDFLNEDTIIKDNPILKNLPHIHDQFLQIAIQTGLIGVILFTLFIFYIFRQPYQDNLVKSVLFAIVALYLTAFFIDVPLRSYTSGLFGFLLGVLAYGSKPILEN